MQYTKLRNYKSQQVNVTHEVPQGFSLKPLLFLMYVNDIPQASQFQTTMFADNTYLTMAENSSTKLKSKVNNELLQIGTWLKQNKLSLNSSKSCYMINLTKTLANHANVISDYLKLVYLAQATRSQISWHLF